MEDKLSAPRDLTEDEMANLRDALKSQLSISSSDDHEDDAQTLLDYAMDMIECGDNVGHIIEELKFMEMPTCDEEAAGKLGGRLTKFFRRLDDDDDDDDGGGSSAGGEEKSSKAEAGRPASGPASVETAGAASPSAPSPLPSSRSSVFSFRGAPPPPRRSFRPSGGNGWNNNNKNESSPKTRLQEKLEKEQTNDRASSPKGEQEQSSDGASLTSSASLKERLAAYQGASTSKKMLHGQESTISTKDDDTSATSYDTPLKADTPILSLKERMAAYQGGGRVSSANLVKDDDGDGDDDGDDDTPLSLKERMSAYQGASVKKTSAAPTKHHPPSKSKKPSAFSPSASSSITKTNIQDRMAKFGNTKTTFTLAPPPEKELTDLQKRMAAFTSKASPSTFPAEKKKWKKGPPPKVSLQMEGRGARMQMQSRMAKYGETAAPAAELASKKNPKPAKRESIAPKSKELQLRMAKYLSTPDLSAGENKKQSVKAIPGSDIERRMSKYQVKEAMSPDGMTEMRPKQEEISLEEPGKGRMPKNQVKEAKSRTDVSNINKEPTDVYETSESQPTEVICPEELEYDMNEKQPADEEISPKPGKPAVNLKSGLLIDQANVVSPNDASKKVIMPEEQMCNMKRRISPHESNVVSPDASDTNKNEVIEDIFPNERVGEIEGRLLKYQANAVSPDTSGTNRKKQPTNLISSEPNEPTGNTKARVPKYQSAMSQSASQTDKEQPTELILPEKQVGDIKGRPSKYQVSISPNASEMNDKKRPTGMIFSEEDTGGFKGRTPKYQAGIADPNASETKEKQPGQNNLQTPMARKSQEATYPNASEANKKQPSEEKQRSTPGEDPMPKETAGNHVQKPTSTFVDFSSLEGDVQKKKPGAVHSSSSSTSAKKSGCDLQDGMAMPVEVSSADASQKKRPEEVRISFIPIPHEMSEIEVLLPAASQKEQPEDEPGSLNPIPQKTPACYMQDIVEVSPPYDNQNEKSKEDVSSTSPISENASQKNEVEGEHSPSSPLPLENIVGELLSPGASQKKKLEEEQRVQAQLESLKSEAGGAEKLFLASTSLVRSISIEVNEHKIIVKKAVMNMEYMEARKKKWVLSRGKKKAEKEYENAVEMVQAVKKFLVDVTKRLEEARCDADNAKREMKVYHEKCQRMEYLACISSIKKYFDSPTNHVASI